MEYKDYICKDQDGNLLIFVDGGINEETLSNDPLFTHCLAVVKVGEEYLLGRNKWRNRFEIFGGCAEKGETARECIEMRSCRYKTFKQVLNKNLQGGISRDYSTLPEHHNIRGKGFYK